MAQRKHSGPTRLLLNSGGLRSAVAAAVTRANHPDAPLVFLHIDDGRDDAQHRRACCEQQAEALDAARVDTIALPALFTGQHTRTPEGRPTGHAHRTHLLLAGHQAARVRRAAELILPFACDQDPDTAAVLTQQIQAARHAAEAVTPHDNPPDDDAALPVWSTPLLDWTDRQVIELGVQADAPFHLAWSCETHTQTPCNACPACQRRRHAFRAAHAPDPLITPMGTAARRG